MAVIKDGRCWTLVPTAFDPLIHIICGEELLTRGAPMDITDKPIL